MEIEQLRQLDAIERLGTMSAAAVELHLSQQTRARGGPPCPWRETSPGPTFG